MDIPQKVVVASRNPVKCNAVREGFSRIFPDISWEIEGVDVPSGVASQPIGNDEIFTGAKNRVANARGAAPDARYWVGIEGGVEKMEGGMEAYAWIAVMNDRGLASYAKTGTFMIPPPVAALIDQGKELGEADDIVFARTDSKKDIGAVGILTGGALDRTHYYADAVMLALIKFKNEVLYET